MTISDETRTELLQKFRAFSPRDLAPRDFELSTQFYEDFDNFKLPLIAYLSDIVEVAIVNVEDHITEEFLRGFVDGAMNQLRVLADLTLTRLDGDPDGAQG